MLPIHSECQNVVILGTPLSLDFSSVVFHVLPKPTPAWFAVCSSFHAHLFLSLKWSCAIILENGVKCRFHAIIEQGIVFGEVDNVERVVDVGLDALH